MIERTSLVSLRLMLERASQNAGRHLGLGRLAALAFDRSAPKEVRQEARTLTAVAAREISAEKLDPVIVAQQAMLDIQEVQADAARSLETANTARVVAEQLAARLESQLNELGPRLEEANRHVASLTENLQTNARTNLASMEQLTGQLRSAQETIGQLTADLSRIIALLSGDRQQLENVSISFSVIKDGLAASAGQDPAQLDLAGFFNEIPLIGPALLQTAREIIASPQVATEVKIQVIQERIAGQLGELASRGNPIALAGLLVWTAES